MRESSNRGEMNRVDVEEKVAATEPGVAGDRNGADLIELLLVLARGKKTILTVTITAAVLATVVSFLLPKTYSATSTILPPQQKQSALNSMLGQIGAIAGLSGGDLGLRNPDDVFVAMLTSRTIEDNLINRFDLQKVYRAKRYQDAREEVETKQRSHRYERGADFHFRYRP